MAKKNKHEFKSTSIEHHSDGSHTIYHQHASDPAKDKHHAVADLSAVHDKLDENLGSPNDGEAAPAAAAPAPGLAGGAAPEPAGM